jgi:hypothetical protein
MTLTLKGALVAALAACACLLAVAPRASAQTAPCPAFHVMHDDHIGTVPVKAGDYTLAPLPGSTMTCAAASARFSRFLADYDGVLPYPWWLDPSTMTFTRGETPTGFTATRTATPTPVPSGGATSGANRCPGTFRVEHDDHIGALKLAAGRYVITGRGMSCGAAARKLAAFLQRPDGKLPSPWRLSPGTATFSGPSGAGFRIKPVA